MEQEKSQRYEKLAKRNQPESREFAAKLLETIKLELETARQELNTQRQQAQEAISIIKKLKESQESSSEDESRLIDLETTIIENLSEADVENQSLEREISQLERQSKLLEAQAAELSPEEQQELAGLESSKTIEEIINEVPQFANKDYKDYETILSDFNKNTEFLKKGEGRATGSLNYDYTKGRYKEDLTKISAEFEKLQMLIANIQDNKDERATKLSAEHRLQLLEELKTQSANIEQQKKQRKKLCKIFQNGLMLQATKIG